MSFKGGKGDTQLVSIKTAVIPAVVVYLAFMVMVGAIIGMGLNSKSVTKSLETIASPPKAKVVEYEDHSARIKVGDTTCVVPAFDSPGDKIVCNVP